MKLEQLLGFLRGHDLISAMDDQQRASYRLKAAAQKQSLWQVLLHQYLFFRIPLWRPDAFLNRAWPWLERFGPRLLRYGLPATLGLGVFLVARDWQRFVGTFPHLFSLGGALAFGVACSSPSCATNSAMRSWPSAPGVGCRAWAWRSWCCCRCFTPMSVMPGGSMIAARAC